MKKNFLILIGLGKNQNKLLKHINLKKFKLIGVDRFLPNNIKDKLYYFVRSSIYDKKKVIKIFKKLFLNNSVSSILYRSSGPSILTAFELENFFNIKRIDKNLAYSILSKSYFYKILKNNKISALKSETSKKYENVRKKENLVIKPDAPIKGKKFIYYSGLNKVKKKYFLQAKKNSFNSKVNLSNYIEGRDISTFYLVNNYKKKIKKISHIEEINKFDKNGSIYSFGICSPVSGIKTSKLIKKEIIDKKIINLFKTYYGIISITSKISKNNIIPYEINIGLSGDRFADNIYPSISRNSLYNIDLNMSLFKQITKVDIIKNKFCGYFMNKKINKSSIFYKLVEKKL